MSVHIKSIIKDLLTFESVKNDKNDLILWFFANTSLKIRFYHRLCIIVT